MMIKSKSESLILSKDEKIQKAALHATKYAEKYTFRKRNEVIESIEMKWNRTTRQEFYNQDTSKWHDHNSLLAAPSGSEMYLYSDSNPNEVTNAPMYYFDQLL